MMSDTAVMEVLETHQDATDYDVQMRSGVMSIYKGKLINAFFDEVLIMLHHRYYGRLLQ